MTRNTKTKELVERVLSSIHTPLGLNEVFEIARQQLPNTAYSTVYRIIQQYELEGKVVKVDWRQRGSRYEWAERPHHHHLVCEACDLVTDIDDEILKYNEEAVSKKTGYKIKAHLIEVTGICKSCQTKN